MGSGVKEMVTDTYYAEDSNQENAFAKYSGHLRKYGYNLYKFVKYVLMTPEYKKALVKTEEEGIYQSRSLRYLAGRQLANILAVDKDRTIMKMAESSEKFTGEAESELKKFEFMDTYFSNSLAPGLYESGSTKQALFTATNEIWLDHAEKIARKGFSIKGDKKKWINELFIELYTREATEKEMDYLNSLLDNTKTYEQSNYYEVVWALINSPEMRLY